MQSGIKEEGGKGIGGTGKGAERAVRDTKAVAQKGRQDRAEDTEQWKKKGQHKEQCKQKEQ